MTSRVSTNVFPIELQAKIHHTLLENNTVRRDRLGSAPTLQKGDFSLRLVSVS